MQDSGGTAPGIEPSSRDASLQRVLKFVVIALGVLILAGVVAVFGRIIYLASGQATQPLVTESIGPTQQTLNLPMGAQVRSISLSGDRLAVHYESGGRTGIAVIDLKTGERATDVTVTPEPLRK